MGLWSFLAERFEHFIEDPTDNVNTGLVANPFMVKAAPDATHYAAGAQFGDVDGAGVQRTSTELWATDDSSLVHVGVAAPEESMPAHALSAIVNGNLWLVPDGESRPVPRTERLRPGGLQVRGPALILEALDTAVDSYRDRFNADPWIEAGLSPYARPLPAVVVYENVDVGPDLDELVAAWYQAEKKPPFWTDARIGELVTSWRAGESSVYMQAGYPIGLPAENAPDGVERPAGIAPSARLVTITVYDELGAPIDLGWLLRHADRHAENTVFDSLVAPNVEIFRKDPVRDLLPRRDVVDLRDEYGLPYRNRAFRRFDAGDFPAITSVFDTEAADLVLQVEPDSTGASGLWVGPEVADAASVVVQGVGVSNHLLAFLPTCASSSVVLKLRGYPGDYHRIVAFPVHKWFPEQPNARPDHAPKRVHLGCRATPLVDGQAAMAVIADAVRATYEQGADDPPSPVGLRPPAALADARVWLCNWTISPTTYPYGGSPALYAALDPAQPGVPDYHQGTLAYPERTVGFYLQSAIAAGVDVRAMPWFNILGGNDRDKNLELARTLNAYYDRDAYHRAGGPGPAADRAAQDVTGLDPIPDNLRRGFAFADDNTRGFGSHHQKVSFVRNRYGDFALLGGVDLVPSRWDTVAHRPDEDRGADGGWHDVHVMLEGPVVQDVVDNFFQRWNAFVADAPDPQGDYPLDLSGLTSIDDPPRIDEEGVPRWPGPASEVAPDAATDPHTRLDRGPQGRRPPRATHMCAVVRTIPPFIDAYDGFVKARPIPDDGAPLGELGCRAAYVRAIENARRYIYLEDQYFIEPELTDLLIARLTHANEAERLQRLFVVVPHILADNAVNDAIYHHYRTQHSLRIRVAVRNFLGEQRNVDPSQVSDEEVSKVFTIAHLQGPGEAPIYLHAKHMIVDDLWMVISSSNFSRRGMTYETEIGVCVSDAEVEDGVRKAVRDHRVRLWAEHLRLERSQWFRLLEPLAGAELLRLSLENAQLPLIEFEIENDEIPFRYPVEGHTPQHELVYTHISDPDGRIVHDLVDAESARAALEALRG